MNHPNIKWLVVAAFLLAFLASSVHWLRGAPPFARQQSKGTAIRITTSPERPIDFMHTKITIDAYDPEGIVQIRAETAGLTKKNVGKLIDINWGDENPDKHWSHTYELQDLFRPRYIGGEAVVDALRELRIIVTIRNGGGVSNTATVTIMFTR